MIDIRAKAVVLACGGFESNAEMRARYLGPNWDLAKVRGTRFNTGAGIKMALDIGAMPYGHWSGCHAVGWDMNAPPFGDLAVGDDFQKHSYPFGIMVNANGERFVDEGADFRNYTYAKYGAVILQPARHVRLADLRREDHPAAARRIPHQAVTKVRANTLEELVTKLEGVDAEACLRELKAYNKAVRTDVPFNSAIKDGRRTEGLKVNKTNWANTIDEPPFEAYARDLRRHLHLRRRQDQHARPRPGRGHRRQADPRPVCRRRTGRRDFLSQLSGRHRPHLGRGVRQARRRQRRRAGQLT